MFGKNKSNQDPDLEIFTIYDSKSEAYENPNYAKNQNVMVRELVNLFKDPRQSTNRFLVNAEDYSLFRIATYSRQTGEVTPIIPIQHCINLHDIRSLVQNTGDHMAPQKEAGPGQVGIVPT